MPKAAVCREPHQPLELVDVDLAAPKANEIGVRIKAAGVCHSDYSVVNGTMRNRLPVVLGHEGAGIVESLGEGVEGFEIGDHVVVSWVPQCGECYFCLRGQPELCEVGTPCLGHGGLLDGTSRFSQGGETVYHFSASGTFSERTVLPTIGAVKIPKDVPLELAAVIGCGVLTGAGAALNTADIRAGDTVVVIGCGGVGLNTIQGAKIAGAERIIAIDRLDNKLEMARTFGATDVVNAGETPARDAVKEIVGKRGADVVFEVIGLQQTIDDAIAMTRRGGQTILVGVPREEVALHVPVFFGMLLKELTIKGCWYGSSDVQRDVPRLIELWREGKLLLEPLISRTIDLDQVNEAFADMETGALARSMITFA
ncbi:MAG: alcohol dehydrogenase [Acidimicrobiia bacterium]|nr:alcohol dehydrogenase [Acidimicrobiia bacterium]